MSQYVPHVWEHLGFVLIVNGLYIFVSQHPTVHLMGL